ncbi:integrase catalytic domain-containing protein [Trichonephila clavipes]|nr:integrase catalytic domain-containing protein [Trichonephila clavipes]
MFKSDVKVILVLGETPGESEEVELERKKLKVVNIDLSRDAPPCHLCFITRRGRPRTIYCDNGTNFRGAFNDLSKLNWSKIVEETRTPKILWKFIPPTAAWWGGWWKRLVRTVKELLKCTLGRSVLKYDELYTVLCDCESIINCRPLTYMSENPEELIPLTPSMFLISNKNSNIEDIEELDSNSLNKRIKYRRSDGKIRTVRLKTQHRKILRPIQRIYPLEIRSNENLQRGLVESIPTVSETLSPDEVKCYFWLYSPKNWEFWTIRQLATCDDHVHVEDKAYHPTPSLLIRSIGCSRLSRFV